MKTKTPTIVPSEYEEENKNKGEHNNDNKEEEDNREKNKHWRYTNLIVMMNWTETLE